MFPRNINIRSLTPFVPFAQANLSDEVKASYTREIITFLHHCKKCHSPATVPFIKQWLLGPRLQVRMPGLVANAELAREALRWFYRHAPKAESAGEDSDSPRMSLDKSVSVTKPVVGNAPPQSYRGKLRSRPPLRPMEPRPAAQDLGGPDWEKALIETMRVRGLLWRTEETYRMWGQRFAAFIAPKLPYAAAAEEVGAFLTDLAVQNRASPSSQRQALNALVFVPMRPVYGRPA